MFTEGYEAIDIILNFQSDNIKGGNKNIKPKYYQLYYKVSYLSHIIIDR